MSKQQVVHRGYYRSLHTNCGKLISSKMKVFVEKPRTPSELKSFFMIDITKANYTTDSEVTCKLCTGVRSPLQYAAYLKKRMLADVGMARSCLQRVRATTGQAIDEANLARLRASVIEWYEAKKLELRK